MVIPRLWVMGNIAAGKHSDTFRYNFPRRVGGRPPAFRETRRASSATSLEKLVLASGPVRGHGLAWGEENGSPLAKTNTGETLARS